MEESVEDYKFLFKSLSHTRLKTQCRAEESTLFLRKRMRTQRSSLSLTVGVGRLLFISLFLNVNLLKILFKTFATIPKWLQWDRNI